MVRWDQQGRCWEPGRLSKNADSSVTGSVTTLAGSFTSLVEK